MGFFRSLSQLMNQRKETRGFPRGKSIVMRERERKLQQLLCAEWDYGELNQHCWGSVHRKTQKGNNPEKNYTAIGPHPILSPSLPSLREVNHKSKYKWKSIYSIMQYNCVVFFWKGAVFLWSHICLLIASLQVMLDGQNSKGSQQELDC